MIVNLNATESNSFIVDIPSQVKSYNLNITLFHT